MKRRLCAPTFFFIVVILFISIAGFSQNGKISGKIISGKTGQPLIGATVSIDSLGKSTASDLNGVYSLSNLTSGSYSVSVSYVSYTKKIVGDVVVTANSTTDLTISLDEKTTANTNEVVVTTRLRRENIGSLLAAQKNSSSVSDGISAEAIRRTPDRNTSDVLKRVSGASIQDDRFAIIRGLNDRYNAAFLNGAPLPSSESDRKAFAFNIFPSNILDNLVIYKTATPDRSGEFGGGIIDITTKSIPSENFMTFSVSGGYNTAATFKEEYKYKGGKWDFLGFDDGKRALPGAVSSLPTLAGLSQAERGRLAKLFDNNWAITSGRFSPNYGFQFTKGSNISRRGSDFLGVLLSLTYSKTSSFVEGERQSQEYDRINPSGDPILRTNYYDRIYGNQTLLGALANFSVKLSAKSTLSFKNILSINGDDRLIRREGQPDASGDASFIARLNARWFTSNILFSSQFSGDHILNKSNLRLNWQGSYATVNRDIPDLRQTVYTGTMGAGAFTSDAANSVNSLVPDNGGTSFFSKTKENIAGAKIDIVQPFTFLGNRQNQLKAGLNYQKRNRDFNARLTGFGIVNTGNFDYDLLLLPEDKIYAPANIGTLSNGKQGFSLLELNRPSYIYDASSELFAGYLMADQRFGRKVRFVYGARLENFNQKLNSNTDNNDPVRIDTTRLDILPSINLIYSVNSKQNFRASYSRTLNRPEFRELAPFPFYDFVTRFTVEGDTNLTRASINNFDVRYEFYPGRAQLFSASGFYKDFSNPIELVTNPALGAQAKYQNALSAQVYGIELEMRSLLGTIFTSPEGSLLNKLTFAANTSILWSNVKIAPIPGVVDPKAYLTDRDLQGQSPYVFNSSLTYANDDDGFSATVSGNRVGDRIYIVGTVNDVDIYERARTVIDFQIAKSFRKDTWEFRATARDILAQKLLFYSDINSDGKYDKTTDRVFSNYKPGSTISASVTYKFNRTRAPESKIPFLN